MNVGSAIQNLRKEQGLTQEEFGSVLHVTRQAVSNWETGKTYPDLQILVDISQRFDISLDTLLKGDVKMIRTIDQERAAGAFKREIALIDMLTGAGTGVTVSCLFSPQSAIRSWMILTGIIMICVGWYRKAKADQRFIRRIEKGG